MNSLQNATKHGITGSSQDALPQSAEDGSDQNQTRQTLGATRQYNDPELS